MVRSSNPSSQKNILHMILVQDQTWSKLGTLWRGSEENDTIMDLLHFGDGENWLGSMVGRQPNDIDVGLRKDMKALDVWGGIWQWGHSMWLYQDDEKEYEHDDLGTTTIVRWTPGVYVSAWVNLFEKLNVTRFGLQAKDFVDFNLGKKLHLLKWWKGTC